MDNIINQATSITDSDVGPCSKPARWLTRTLQYPKVALWDTVFLNGHQAVGFIVQNSD